MSDIGFDQRGDRTFTATEGGSNTMVTQKEIEFRTILMYKLTSGFYDFNASITITQNDSRNFQETQNTALTIFCCDNLRAALIAVNVCHT